LLIAVIRPETHPVPLGTEHDALEVPPTVPWFVSRQRNPLARESPDVLQRSNRALQARRTHFEVIAPRDRLVHVETVRQSPAELRAIPETDAPGLVEIDTEDPVTPRGSLLNVHQFVAVLVREGAGDLANLFSHIHFGSSTDKERSGRTCPTPAGNLTD
jgi:hypothetical protein